jgi:anti-sigma factor RsiW
MNMPAHDHAAHDTELIAAHLDGTLDRRDETRVHEWLASCATCAAIRTDIEALAMATRSLPAATRSRDFTLSADQARHARAGGWRRIVAAIGSPRDALSRPLAVGLTTLGLAGLLIATVPSIGSFGSLGGAASASSAPAVETTQGDDSRGVLLAPLANPLPDDTSSPGANDYGVAQPVPSPAAALPAASAAAGAITGSSAEPQRDTVAESAQTQPATSGQSGGPSALTVASLALLLAGLALALVRWGARRLGDG